MKYCFNYSRRAETMSLLDEINIKFDPEDMELMFDYILEHKHQRINAKIVNERDIYTYDLFEKFEAFKDDNPDVDFAIILPKYDSNLAKLCGQKELKFYFDVVVRDWETFNSFIQLGVSDIFLVEQMMFEIKDASAAAHKAGVRVRTFPNIAQRKYDETTSIKSFFIRPEDITLYEGLVDVMEIYTVEEINEDVVFEIYREDKMWWGPLKEIIIGLASDIDGRYIIPRFGDRRLNCGRKCFKGQRCDVCETVEQLGKNLEKAGLLIQYDKEKKESNEDGKGTSEQDTNNK